MRIALIATDDAGYDPGRDPARLGGRPLSLHQLDFALGQGCTKVLCLGHGASPEAIALRHAAEGAGVQFQVLRGARDLPAAVRSEDELLVFARGLLPDSPAGFEALRKGPAILSLPVQPGAGAGFELLDLTTAWGGAMAIPGRLADRLDMLPDDADAVSGLLRIARQAGVPERAIPEAELAEGRWVLLRDAEQSAAAESGWLRRRLQPGSPWRPSAWLSRLILRRFGAGLSDSRRARPLAQTAAILAIGGAIAAAYFGYFLGGLALLSLAALAIDFADGVAQLARPSFAGPGKSSKVSLVLGLLLDAAMVSVAALAIPGSLHRRIFLALLPVALVRFWPSDWPFWRGLVTDRGLLAAALAVAVGLDMAEKGAMVAVLAILAARILPFRKHRS